ncbi:MAG: hypothetical protein WCK95_28565, partial [Alphaproteobacteria bacterium]
TLNIHDHIFSVQAALAGGILFIGTPIPWPDGILSKDRRALRAPNIINRGVHPQTDSMAGWNIEQGQGRCAAVEDGCTRRARGVPLHDVFGPAFMQGPQ